VTLTARVKRLSKTFSEGYKVAKKRKLQAMSGVELTRMVLLLHRQRLNQDGVAELALIDEGLSLLEQMKTDEPLKDEEWVDFRTRYKPLHEAFMVQVREIVSKGRD
jgi:hypothetical protein